MFKAAFAKGARDKTMKKTTLLAASVLCLGLTAGAAFAAGDGDGPYGTPDTAASMPKGVMSGSVTYKDEMQEYRAAGYVKPDAAAGDPDYGLKHPAPVQPTP